MHNNNGSKNGILIDKKTNIVTKLYSRITDSASNTILQILLRKEEL